MKRILLVLSAVLLFSGAVNAQFKSFTLPETGQQLRKPVLKGLAATTKKAPRKVLEIAENQKWIGNYSTDELCPDNEAIGLPNYAGRVKAFASYVPGSVFARFVDNKIVGMRIGIIYPSGPVRLYAAGIDARGQISDELFSVSIENVVSGWNEALLDQPYTLTKKYENYLLVVEYTQLNTNNGQYYNNECYPFSAISSDDAQPLYAYGDLGQGEGFYSVANLNLSIQVLVESDQFLLDDICITDLGIQPFTQSDQDVKAFLFLRNEGKGTISDYSLAYSVDGNEAVVLTQTAPVTNEDTEIDFSLGKYGIGKHRVKVWIDKVAGEAPVGVLTDDVAEGVFYVYDKAVKRQKHLIEQFTSTSCTYCPLGVDLLKMFTESREDMIWVGIHGIMNPNIPDVMNNAVCDTIMSMEGVSSYPSGAFDRVYLEDNTTATSLGYDPSYHSLVISQMLNPLFDMITESYPALASVEIDAQYDANTKKMNVTVSGEGAENAAKALSDGMLTVYLVEDGIKADQLNQGKWSVDFVHNGVLRTALGKCTGNPIKWNGDNYSDTFTCELAEEWNVENMKVVAFIHLPYTGDDSGLTVLNANVNTIKDVTAIKDVANDVKAQETARYNAAGQLVGKGHKGLNIIRLDNGKAVKVIEK